MECGLDSIDVLMYSFSITVYRNQQKNMDQWLIRMCKILKKYKQEKSKV